MQCGGRIARSWSVTLFIVAGLACGGGSEQAKPDPAVKSAQPGGATNAPADLGLDGVCSPAAPSACGEWCEEHGLPEADCNVCKARVGHPK